MFATAKEMWKLGRERLLNGWNKGDWEDWEFDEATGEGKPTYCLEGAMGLFEEMSYPLQIIACSDRRDRESVLDAYQDWELSTGTKKPAPFVVVGYRSMMQAVKDFCDAHPEHPTSEYLKVRVRGKDGTEAWHEIQPLDFNDQDHTKLDDVLWVWDRAEKYAMSGAEPEGGWVV